jgi:cadmium resistance protein CadD (predicted permease)
MSDPFRIQNYRAYLLRGLLWLLAGLAITLCLAVLTPPLFDGPRATALLGLIPVFVGIAYLIFYWTESRRAEAEEDSHETLSISRP